MITLYRSTLTDDLPPATTVVTYPRVPVDQRQKHSLDRGEPHEHHTYQRFVRSHIPRDAPRGALSGYTRTT